MKKYAVVVLGLLLAGCTYEGKKLDSYVNDPASIIQDPHFAGFQEKKDTVESQYLRKEINFAEYTKQIKELDDKYNQEVKTEGSRNKD